MTTFRRKKHGLQGFTLVEILVAVAVIAILAGLSFGAYSSAISQARAVECVNNLRQQGVVLNLYTVENGGLLPAALGNDDPGGSGQEVSWLIVLQHTIDMRFPRVGEKNILLCPSAAAGYPGGLARRTYGMNVAGGDGRTPRRLTTFTQPSQTVLITDTVAVGTQGDGSPTFGLSDMTTSPDWRHGGGVQALFVDGHVEKIHSDQEEAWAQYVENYVRSNQ